MAVISAEKVRSGLTQFMQSPIFDKIFDEFPLLLLVFASITLLLAIVSPIVTSFAMLLEDWFKVETKTSLRWFHFLYITLAAITGGLVVTELIKLKRFANTTKLE